VAGEGVLSPDVSARVGVEERQEREEREEREERVGCR
jgi:hypothetical protein